MGTETLYGVRLSMLFSLSGAVALPCWLLLLVAPRWRVSQLLATFVAQLLIGAAYILLLVSHKTPPGSGFGSLSQVSILFQSPFALLAGWIHHPAFDLFTGAWQARDASGFGPAGLALYLLLKLTLRRTFGAIDEVMCFQAADTLFCTDTSRNQGKGSGRAPLTIAWFLQDRP